MPFDVWVEIGLRQGWVTPPRLIFIGELNGYTL